MELAGLHWWMGGVSCYLGYCIELHIQACQAWHEGGFWSAEGFVGLSGPGFFLVTRAQ